MDMDVDGASRPKEGKAILVILVGAPGSGKSTFCEEVMRSSTRPWIRVCQDTIGNGKAGSKAQCLSSAASALKDHKSVFIDRCNLDREQRSEFVKLGDVHKIDVHAVVLDLPAKLCISRSVKRTGHEGNLQGGKAAAVVNRMLQKKELPKLSEGYSRITFCQSESDVKGAINTYGSLGPLDNLPHGCFGQKNPDSKVQVGIMKFLKKVPAPDAAARPDGSGDTTSQNPGKNDYFHKDVEMASPILDNPNLESKEGESQGVAFDGSHASRVSLDDAPTLAFPSISTSDFQFNYEKAADIIVEKVAEFTAKLGNARLVLVDLTHKSKILSLVKAKASEKRIDTQKFLTHVGDITKLHSTGGLNCNVIANAANWRLKAGGGGVNAAIFNAAGPELESATKERAKSLSPGNAVVVPLPASSPLFVTEGVTHVIHVLGPNMNPQRPNCLNNDYEKGCKILQDAYASLFEGFASIVRTQAGQSREENENIVKKALKLQDKSECHSRNNLTNIDQKNKRDADHGSEKSKKCKGIQDSFGVSSDSRDERVDSEHRRNGGSMNKAWGSWAQALHQMAMHPEKHKDDLLEISEDVVVLNDLYPKAKKHVLILSRTRGVDCLEDVQKEHFQLLKKMHDVGLKWARKFLDENASLVFRLGYHSAPSMRQLHLHVISQDFDSKHMKNKKHWNSFNTAFFRDSIDVMDEVSSHGKATLKDDDKLLSMELRCHRCRSAHPNIPRLKSHIGSCKAPFPAYLLENGRLVHAPAEP
ncbi:transcription factor bHLH140 isoform X1 [Arachis stenosperma]|uniref:transcription factor bHLH140 isoform X1 n=1 Tax=Arachis stenosperma TaxID=217475 RepID=UPI0025AD508F|nr:transcription factor bHLH140 isoform X1 [Arachis stenosperma]